VGGVPKSAHTEGRAADFHSTCGLLATAFEAIAASAVAFDQLIIEHTRAGSAWIHLAIPRAGETPRRQVLTASGPTAGAMTYDRVAEG
jgi:hypothetical protein